MFQPCSTLWRVPRRRFPRLLARIGEKVGAGKGDGGDGQGFANVSVGHWNHTTAPKKPDPTKVPSAWAFNDMADRNVGPLAFPKISPPEAHPSTHDPVKKTRERSTHPKCHFLTLG